MAGTPTDYEQLMLELVNWSRLDPVAAARKYDVGLNEGLAAGTISTGTKQPLAFDLDLIAAARAHSTWMLNTDTFSHTGSGGSSPQTRVAKAGFELDGTWRVLENLAYYGATGTLDRTEAVESMILNLFLSEEHRVNTLNGTVRQIGIGLSTGTFTVGGSDYKTLMATEDFALSGTGVFVTGVIYKDSDGDDFYSVGEGVGGLRVAVGSARTTSWSSGGYQIELADGATSTVTFGTGRSAVSVRAQIGSENAKIDLVDSTHVQSSVSLTLLSGVTEATLLGRNDLTLTGTSAAERLVGNVGDNRIWGGSGNDTLVGGDGADTLSGGGGSDTVSFDTSTSGVTASLTRGSAGDASGDVYLSIEHMIGSSASDRLTGNSLGNRIQGGNGHDTLSGGAGNDALWGQNGNDSLRGGSGADALYGGAGTDRLFGDSGNDVLTGGAGRDTLTGGTGADRFHFTSRSDLGDRVMDFTSRVDTLSFDHDSFSGMSAGSFRLVNAKTPVATTTLQTFLFDTDSHRLLFDADGRGSGKAVLVATLDDVSVLRSADIHIL